MRLLIPLFSPPTGTWGGLTRGLALAEAARRAGHAVAFCASGPMADALRWRDWPVFRTPAPTLAGLPAVLSRFLVRHSQRVALPGRAGRSTGNIWLVYVATGYHRPAFLRHLVDAERAAARDFGADVLFTDLDPGAVLLAQIEQLPLAMNYAQIGTIGAGTWCWRLVARAANRTLADFGQPARTPDELCFGPAVLKIIPSIPELEDTDPARADVRFVGPTLGELRLDNAGEGFRAAPGTRYVFAYVGTGSIPLDRLRAVLPRVFTPGSPTRCIVAAQSITRVQQIGAVEFRPYISAEALLPHCDWMLGHGGQNSIMQALVHGVPLLLFPGSVFERRYNAQKVVAAGAGMLGERSQFRPDWLRAALARQPEFAAGAQRLRARLGAFGGAPAAVAAIEDWLRQRQPVLTA